LDGISVQALNGLGQVAAQVIDADGRWHGFVGDGDDYTIFDHPDPELTYTLPYMANNRETSVGECGRSDGTFHAYKLEDGAFVYIDPPEAPLAGAGGINNRGVS
jgi:hypothetical protein